MSEFGDNELLDYIRIGVLKLEGIYTDLANISSRDVEKFSNYKREFESISNMIFLVRNQLNQTEEAEEVIRHYETIYAEYVKQIDPNYKKKRNLLGLCISKLKW